MLYRKIIKTYHICWLDKIDFKNSINLYKIISVNFPYVKGNFRIY